MFFFGGGAHVHINAKIEAARSFQFIPDKQRDFARGAAVHQDLGRRNRRGGGYGRISNRDALDGFGGIDQQTISQP